MTGLYLSKSKYCAAVQCPKMLWMHKYRKELFDDSVLDESILLQGSDVGNLAKGIFGDFKEVKHGNLAGMIEETNRLINGNTPVICEASFSYNGLFCSVDVLRKNNTSFEIYEVKSLTEINDIYLHDIAYQYYVLTMLGFNVTKASLVYINSSYVKQGELSLDEFFIIEDVTDIVENLQPDVEQRISYLAKYMMQENEPSDDIGDHCFKPYKCGYWQHCTCNLPSPNIFDIRRIKTKTKFEHYRNDIISFSQALEYANLKSIYEDQVAGELFNKAVLRKDRIENFLGTLSYPLYFLDFETFQRAIPVYYGTSPFQQIPFQYSLHIIMGENTEIIHKEFLAESGTDPRRDIAERLVKDIPQDVCVLAYYMSFEKSRIEELANCFPDLKEHLMSINKNMKDLIDPFMNHDYYLKAMKGSYSIKYVLPALFPDDSELDYSNLKGIHNGREAMTAFAELEGKTQEEKAVIRNQLLQYCKLDTYAMVKIWQKLLSFTR